MGQLDMSAYLKQLESRYMKADRKGKSQILNEFCATSGKHRKHVIRLLTRTPIGWRNKPAGRKKHYYPNESTIKIAKLAANGRFNHAFFFDF